MSVRVLHGDCREVLRTLDTASVHAVVTDPPAGISFMGRAWDGDKGGRDHWIAWMREVASECLRVAKPGAHALVWALPRTSHWTATAWEDAGWQVRDRIAHLFGSGFPKSLDVSKAIDAAAGAEREVVGSKIGLPGYHLHGHDGGEAFGCGLSSSTPMTRLAASQITAPATEAARQWAGWGTSLKPACEDWWLLRKPLIGTVAANVQAHGTGAINVDACRVAASDNTTKSWRGAGDRSREEYRTGTSGAPIPTNLGRWPANVCHSGEPEVEAAFAAFGEKGGGHWPDCARSGGGGVGTGTSVFKAPGPKDTDSGSASRFFFCGKATAEDRAGSKHPTIKPLSLISWLTKLITPPGGTVLDPFAGSGTTLLAADRLGFDAIGIEQDAEYVADIHRRMQGDCPLFAEVSA